MSIDDREIALDLAATLPTEQDRAMTGAALRALGHAGYEATGDLDGTAAAQEKAAAYPGASDPYEVAKAVIGDLFAEEDSATGAVYPTLRFWRQDWWKFDEDCWTKVTERDIKNRLWPHLARQHYERRTKEDVVTELPWRPTRAKISDVMDAMISIVSLPTKASAPMWVPEAEMFPPYDCAPGDLIGMSNGLLNWRTRTLERHTPALFNVTGLGFCYDPDAACPSFDAFMADAFEHDPLARETVAQWAGYLVSGRNDLQKALYLWGKRRAGKGVLSRLLRRLVGEENVDGTSFSELGDRFGLASLMDKSLAIIGDARFDKGIGDKAVERILSITGGDLVGAEKKNLDKVPMTIGARFMAMSNVPLRASDSSGAIVSRFMIVKMVKSHAGHEDTTLEHRLAQELPGIMNWALRGLEQLEKQGNFTVPASDSEDRQDMLEASSPLLAFASETYHLTGNAEDTLPRAEAWAAYKSWCAEVGRLPGYKKDFELDLPAAVDGVEAKQTNPASGKRVRVFTGLTTTPALRIASDQSPLWDDTTSYTA